MLPYFWYLLKVIICSGILFGYYWLFLRNKIFHQYNRFYLLAAMSLSLLLPLLKINFWQPAATQNQAIRVLQAVSAGDEYMSSVVITAPGSNWSFEQLYPIVYWLISIIFFVIMLRTIFLILTLLKRYTVQQIEEVSFVNTEDDSTPFSFFKYIFWNSSIDINTTTGRQIFKHEVAHIQEKHTHDKFFVNIVLIFCWCNPFFWLYRKELNMIHEFIADKKAVENSDTAAFAAMILQAAYPRHRFELTNNFFYSPIKRRLLMLTKNNSPKVSYIARLMVLPLAVLVFAAFTFKAKNNNVSIYHGKKITVVIDAGHGGKDLGATGADGIYEKDLTLAIAKKVEELNNNEAIEIVLIRDEDVYMESQQKVAFAKSKNADLFISFHIDNGPKESANKHTGISFWVAKDEFPNAGQSKVFASAIVNEFNRNYGLPVIEQLNQRKAGVWILQANTCPAVLIEAGFINNDKDIAYLQTSAAKETIAKNLLIAIEKFASMNKAVPATIEQTLPKETMFQKIKDTLPENAAIDPEKALLIVNGKIMGKGKKADGVLFNNLVAQSVIINWLNRKEATAKYGSEGADGACEVNYIDGAVFTTAYADADNMSVVYVGIDNPIKINVPNVKPEDIVVSISDGSVSGNNGNYIVKVTNTGDVTLTLSKRDGTKIPASFRVKAKRLPEPSDPNFPIEIRKNLNYDNSNSLLLNQKLIEEQAKLNIAEKEKVALWQKLNDQQILNEKLAATNLGNVEKDRVVLGRKLNELDLQKEKEKLVVEEQAESKLNNIENDKVVLGRKLNELEMLKLKQKMLLDKRSAGIIEVREDELEPLARQKNELLAQQNNKVFTKVEIDPQFTGGEEAWRKYLRENLNLKAILDKGARAGKYTVVLVFMVNIDGSLSDIKCDNDPGFGACAEALRFIKTTPRWQPAIQNGKKVNAYVRKPITFFITGGKGSAGNTSWNNIKTTRESNAYYVSAQPYMSFSRTPYVLASIKPAIEVKFTAAYTNKVCSNISVQK